MLCGIVWPRVPLCGKYGVVSYLVVWCGIVWYFFGIVLYCVALFTILRCFVVLGVIVWYCAELGGNARYRLVWFSIARICLVLFGIGWYRVVLCGTVRC